MDWAEQILEPFRYGETFLEMNEELFERYSKCANSDEVAKVESDYLDELEKEYTDRRTGIQPDSHGGGNPNRQKDDEDDEDEDDEEGDGQGRRRNKDPFDISDDDDEEEEERMAAIRQQVLASRQFTNVARPEPTVKSDVTRNRMVDSDEEDEDEDDLAEGIYTAEAVPEEAGPSIIRGQSGRAVDEMTAVFRVTDISAPAHRTTT